MSILSCSILLASVLSSVMTANAGELILRTMSQDGYPSKFNFSDKKKPGNAIEIIQALERVDPGIRIIGMETSASTARIFTELENGRIDIMFALATNPERAAKAQFSEPALYTTYQKLAVRADDTVEVKGFDDIRKLGKDGVILVTATSAQVAYLKTQKGLILDDGSASTEENLKKLVAKRGRFYYGSDMGLQGDVAKLQLEDKIKILPVSFQKEDVFVLFSKQTPSSSISRVKAGIEKLKNSGELARIHSRYLPK